MNGLGPLVHHTTMTLEERVRANKVHDYVNGEEVWDWHLLGQILPQNVCTRMAGFFPPSRQMGPDQVYWQATSNGECTTRLAYELSSKAGWGSNHQTWDIIRHWKGPQRIWTFIWLVAKNSILTNENRMKRHLTPSPLCERCYQHSESVLQCLRDCTQARDIW